jgi:HTH-type transcriptional regulator / antitoxin HigA
MVQTTELKAARKFGPGYFIKEQMELRSWIQEDLAEVMGISVKHLNKILNNNQPLTLDIARLLGEIFNTSPHYWINIDTGYRIWHEQKRKPAEVSADLKSIIYERMPVNDMIKKGWLNKPGTVEDLKRQVLKFWGWKKLDFSILDKNYLPFLTRKSDAYNQFNASYAITWFRKAVIEADRHKHQPYEKKRLVELYDNLYSYTTKKNGINLYIKELEQAGVIFFVLPHLQKTYLDGASFFSGDNPVIVYTGRYRRIDNFWFTVAHEIAHILDHLNEKLPFILDNLQEGEINHLEREANRIAAEKLKHNEIISFLGPHLKYLTTNKVEECAEIYDIHPAVITGKLAQDKKISYKHQSLYNDDVLGIIQKKYQVK